MRREIAEQPEALARTLAELVPRLGELRAAVGERRHVLFIARGSSDQAARYGSYLLALRAGRAVASASPSVATLYEADLDLADTVAVAISQSGATGEIVQTLAWAGRNGARTVGITNEADSALVEAAEVAVVTRAGHERALPATKSHTTQLLAVAALAAAIGGDPAEGDRLRQVPDAVATALEQAEAARALAERLDGARTVVTAARGYASATAGELALKLQETCRIPALGLSWADLLHGPLALLAPDTPVVLVAPGHGPTLAATAGAVRRLVERGAPVHAIGGDAVVAAACASALPAPDLPEHLAPIALVVPGQLAVEALAHRLGLDPDRPAGLRKVTRTDDP